MAGKKICPVNDGRSHTNDLKAIRLNLTFTTFKSILKTD